jgi:hypothetical protein
MVKLIAYLMAIASFLCPAILSAQSTLRITFDGPPYQPPGSAYIVQSYYESGMSFQPLPGSDGFTRDWTGAPSGWPDDGTPYLMAGAGDSLTFSFTENTTFGLATVDLAAFSTGFPNYTVNFVGYHADGSTITTSFSGNGIAFQTYNFNSLWSTGLTRVDIPNYAWSLDNLAVIVPEPDSLVLFLVGVVILFLKRKNYHE